MVLAGNKAKRLSLVSHTTKTIHNSSLSSSENFWIRTLETLQPHRLNHKLNPK